MTTVTHTHRQLCDLAVNWLRRPACRTGPGCQVAFSEARGDWTGEMPDAIGFRAAVHNEASVLVEVKVSRSDFLADRKKPHRINPALGMGVYRYYMAPQGIIPPGDLPDRWGLIEVTTNGTLKVLRGHVFLKYHDVDTWRHERAQDAEWTLLVRMLNRVGDVEKAQSLVKEANNRNACLARENDKLRAEVERMRLQSYLVDRGVSATAGERARPKKTA